MNDHRYEAYAAWGVLAVFILVFDLIAHKVGGVTLTAAFRTIRAHPIRHALLTAVWGGITWHLFEKQVHQEMAEVLPFPSDRSTA